VSRSPVGSRRIAVVEQEGWATSGLSAPLASPGLRFYFVEAVGCAVFLSV
jgi:hypothetical protein